MTARVAPLRMGDIVRVRGERWRIARQLPYDAVAIVEVNGCDTANRGTCARFLLPFELLDRLSTTPEPRVVRPGRWRHVARRVLADAAPSWSSLRAATRANLTLIPFQLEPALALARGDGCRFLIADGVGLGKTVQAGLMIAEVLQRHAEARAIVVSPSGLREQWRDELTARFKLEAHVLDAGSVARVTLQLPVGMNPWSVHPLVITSIDYVKRPEVMRCLETLIWDLVVFDEAHGLAGRSDRAAAAAALGSRARALVMLTATPHSGDDEAFVRMCSIGDLGDGHPLLMFRRTRADAEGLDPRRTVLLRVRPTDDEAAMHAALMEYARRVWTQPADGRERGARLVVSVLTRRACSSAASLARSIERRITLLAAGAADVGVQPGLPFADSASDDEEPQAVLGMPGLQDRVAERRHLERILHLAGNAARFESKLAVLRRFLTRTEEPAIVFTEYRDTLERVAAAVAGTDAVQLHGGLTSHDRASALRRFTHGAARLLLATDAASEGLNLHRRCRLVINLELPWTPVRLEQRAGRVDRIGQPRRVHAVHLVAAQTSEEDVLARLARRMTRMHRTIGFLERLPGEQRIAESVLGGAMLPELAAGPSPAAPAGIVVPDLVADARAEAARIAGARALLQRDDASTDESRPLLTRLRRRLARSHRRTLAPSHPHTVAPSHPRGLHCFWLFRLRFTGPDDRIVWESLLPIGGTTAPMPAGSAVATRTLLDPRYPAVLQLIAREHEERLRALALVLHRPLHVWTDRERALMSALREHHARLSSGLLQLGLFDRRHERLAAAQAALLDDAVSRSSRRLAEIARYEQLQADSYELVFAVALE